MNVKFDIGKTEIANRQRVADELGISLDTLLALGLEQILLRMYNRMSHPFPENMFDAFTPQEEES